MTMYCTVLTMLTFSYTKICNEFFEVFQNNFWLLSLSLLWMGKCCVSLNKFLEQLAMSSNIWLSLYRIHQFLEQNESELMFTDGTPENPKKAFKELDHDSPYPIVLENVTMRYEDDPDKASTDQSISILKNISLKIKRHSKVGILGKDNSGKHSLLYLVLNLYLKVDDPGAPSSLKIYGEPIENISSSDIRRNILYLAPNPILFAGKIRDNIDPYGKHTTETLMKVLYYLNLSEMFKAEETLVANDE
jgi:ABC-type multidrug transport system fused ATPase/permease subunit